MPNNKIGSEPVKRRTLSLEDSDWDELNNLVIFLKLNGISSLVRSFLRLYSKHRAIVTPLLLALVSENDRIQPETKAKVVTKGKYDIKDVIIGAKKK